MGWWEEECRKLNFTVPTPPTPNILIPQPPKQINRLTAHFSRQVIDSTTLSENVFPFRNRGDNGNERTAAQEIGIGHHRAFILGLNEAAKRGIEFAPKGIGKSRKLARCERFATIPMFETDQTNFNFETEMEILQRQISWALAKLPENPRVHSEFGIDCIVGNRTKTAGQFTFRCDTAIESNSNPIRLIECKSIERRKFSDEKILLAFFLLALTWTIVNQGKLRLIKGWQKQFKSSSPLSAISLRTDCEMVILFSDEVVTPNDIGVGKTELQCCQETVNDWLLYLLATD